MGFQARFRRLFVTLCSAVLVSVLSSHCNVPSASAFARKRHTATPRHTTPHHSVIAFVVAFAAYVGSGIACLLSANAFPPRGAPEALKAAHHQGPVVLRAYISTTSMLWCTCAYTYPYPSPKSPYHRWPSTTWRGEREGWVWDTTGLPSSHLVRHAVAMDGRVAHVEHKDL